jgi:hypothetical protein
MSGGNAELQYQEATPTTIGVYRSWVLIPRLPSLDYAPNTHQAMTTLAVTPTLGE